MSPTAPLVVTGRGALRELPSRCDTLHLRRVLLVASGSVESTAGLVRHLLGRRLAGRYSHTPPHVPAKEANLAVASAQEIHADAVVGLGGGSAIGLAKVVAVALRLPLIAAPTTYAGAEMTDRFLVTTDRGKESRINDRALPRLVLRDPVITVGTPPKQTAASGMTAVGHCLETLSHDMANEPVRTALEDLWSVLPRLLDTPDDLELRERALHAAGVAGASRLAGPGPLAALAEQLIGRRLTESELMATDGTEHGVLVGHLAQQMLSLPGPESAAMRSAIAEASGDRHPADKTFAAFFDRLGLRPEAAPSDEVLDAEAFRTFLKGEQVVSPI